MSIEEKVLETLKTLPPEKQQEVLDLAVSLAKKPQGSEVRPNLYGFCADLSTPVTLEDIREARREMWSSFPL